MGRPGLTRHRKFLRLARSLGSAPLARGVLELMWDSAYEHGDEVLGDEIDVAHACSWDGEPAALVRALLEAGGADEAGFIDPDPERPGRFRVHDLWHHAPDYVQKRRRREEDRRSKADPTRRAADGDRRTAPRGGRWRASPVCQDGDDLPPAPAPAPAPGDPVIVTSPCSEPQAAREPEGGRREEKGDEPHGADAPPAAGNGAPRPDRHSPGPGTPPEDSEAPGEAVEVLPCVGAGSKSYRVDAEKLAAWSRDFPALDVRDELRRMRAWLEANPSRRKTERGTPRFIVSWLSRAQDRAPPPGARPAAPAPSPLDAALARSSGIWREVLTEASARLIEQARREVAEKWLAPLTASVPRDGGGALRLVLAAPTKQHATFVRDNYLAGLTKLAERAAGEPVEVEIRGDA